MSTMSQQPQSQQQPWWANGVNAPATFDNLADAYCHAVVSANNRNAQMPRPQQHHTEEGPSS